MNRLSTFRSVAFNHDSLLRTFATLASSKFIANIMKIFLSFLLGPLEEEGDGDGHPPLAGLPRATAD